MSCLFDGSKCYDLISNVLILFVLHFYRFSFLGSLLYLNDLFPVLITLYALHWICQNVVIINTAFQRNY